MPSILFSSTSSKIDEFDKLSKELQEKVKEFNKINKEKENFNGIIFPNEKLNKLFTLDEQINNLRYNIRKKYLINIDKKFLDDAFVNLPLLPEYKNQKNQKKNVQSIEKYKEQDPIQCEGMDAHINGTCTYKKDCKKNIERIYYNTKQSISNCKVLTTKVNYSAEEVYDNFALGNLYAHFLDLNLPKIGMPFENITT